MIWLWLGFLGFVVIFLILDLGVFHRDDHVVSTAEALGWTAFWVLIALLFNVGVYFLYEHHWLGIGTELGLELAGKEAALKFFTGYLLETSLSLDNIFVIALIFSYFQVPLQYQHRVLFWGILGAVVLRAVMIVAGLALMAKFEWIVYVFGGLLIVTAVKMKVSKSEHLHPDRNVLVRIARYFYPVSSGFDGSRFFTRVEGKRAVTPLFLALVLVESSDVLFAVDSIPAIFAVTRDPFLVFTSNIFAILGLRSLYFALAAGLERFRYLNLSLVALLLYIGVKMLLTHHYPIPAHVSLIVVISILGLGVLFSIFGKRKEVEGIVSPLADNLEELAHFTYRNLRRVVVLILGVSTVLVGVIMIVTPGPAVVVIPAGLGILATEFVWARKLLKRARDSAGPLRDYVEKAFTRDKKK